MIRFQKIKSNIFYNMCNILEFGVYVVIVYCVIETFIENDNS